MARYTKKDREGHYYIELAGEKHYTDVWGHLYGEAINKFAELENADVVPKSEVDWHREAELNAQRIIELEAEVERLQIEIQALNIANEKMYSAIEATKSEVAREIFEEIESRLLNHIADYYGCYHKTFDELKKKYTEGEQRND